jgi:hypothetical protein
MHRAITVHVGTVLVMVAAAAAIAARTPLVFWLPGFANAPTPLVLVEFSRLCGGVAALASVLEFHRMSRSQLVVQFTLGAVLFIWNGGSSNPAANFLYPAVIVTAVFNSPSTTRAIFE